MFAMTAAHKTLPDPELRARDQPRDRPVGGGAGERPRPLPRRARDRPLLRRGGEARHRRARQRDGGGRARLRARRRAAAATPPPAGAAPPAAARPSTPPAGRWHTPAGRELPQPRPADVATPVVAPGARRAFRATRRLFQCRQRGELPRPDRRATCRGSWNPSRSRPAPGCTGCASGPTRRARRPRPSPTRSALRSTSPPSSLPPPADCRLMKRLPALALAAPPVASFAARSQAITPPPVAARAYYLLDTLSGQALAAAVRGGPLRARLAHQAHDRLPRLLGDPRRQARPLEDGHRFGEGVEDRGLAHVHRAEEARHRRRPDARHDRAVRQRRHDRARGGRRGNRGDLRRSS